MIMQKQTNWIYFQFQLIRIPIVVSLYFQLLSSCFFVKYTQLKQQNSWQLRKLQISQDDFVFLYFKQTIQLTVFKHSPQPIKPIYYDYLLFELSSELLQAMIIKQSTASLKIPMQHKKSSPSLLLQSPRTPFRSNKIFSELGPRVTIKRAITIDSQPPQTQRRHTKVNYCRNLFKNAKKVDMNNPRESFLNPTSHRGKPEQPTRVKIVLSAYNKTGIKGEIIETHQTSQKSPAADVFNIDDLKLSTEIKTSAFYQPQMSSLTQLIFNQCKLSSHLLQMAEEGAQKKIDDSLSELCGENSYSQWIKILCEDSHIKNQQNQNDEVQEENPYGLENKKKNKRRRLDLKLRKPTL